MENLKIDKNIVLIGYRGAGKSYVSKKIAEILQMDRCSSDEWIEKKVISIAQYVKEKGWEAFRDIETSVIEEIGQKRGIVIDCGGGVVEREKNMILLRKGGVVFYLKATYNDILLRLSMDEKRPPLKDSLSLEEEVRTTLLAREPLYQRFAHFSVDTSGFKIFRAHKEILSLWENNKNWENSQYD